MIIPLNIILRSQEIIVNLINEESTYLRIPRDFCEQLAAKMSPKQIRAPISVTINSSPY